MLDESVFGNTKQYDSQSSCELTIQPFCDACVPVAFSCNHLCSLLSSSLFAQTRALNYLHLSCDLQNPNTQNHGGWKGLTPLLKQGQLEQVAQDSVLSGLEYLQRWRLHSLPGQPLPVFDHSLSKRFFLCLDRVSCDLVCAHCFLPCQ